jgi:hypothetical protein
VTVSSQEDNDLPSESDVRARLVALMGGRAAEELLFHEVTGGASNDFEKANQVATTMVTKWGMGRDPETKEDGASGRGSLSFLVARQNGSLPTEVQPAATRAIVAILDDAYAQALSTLTTTWHLRRIAATLVDTSGSMATRSTPSSRANDAPNANGSGVPRRGPRGEDIARSTPPRTAGPAAAGPAPTRILHPSWSRCPRPRLFPARVRIPPFRRPAMPAPRAGAPCRVGAAPGTAGAL